MRVSSSTSAFFFIERESNIYTGNTCNALLRKWIEEMFDYLSLNDLLRRSVDLMCSAYTNHYQTRTIRRNRNSNKIVLSGSCVFRATVLSKAVATFVLVLTVSLVSCLTSLVKNYYVKRASYFNWVMCWWSGTRLIFCFFYFICHSYILLWGPGWLNELSRWI